MTVRFGRACLAAFCDRGLADALVSAQATEQATPKPEGRRAEAGRGAWPVHPADQRGKYGLVHGPMDPGRHMSKTQWKTVCLRIQTDR